MISLVVATFGRYKEVVRLFDSLQKSSFKDLEVVLVDQNDQIDLLPIVNQYQEAFKIKHIKTENIGANVARNTGANHSSGTIIAFPDDDCWYDIDTLQNVVDSLKRNNSDGIFGVALDNNGEMSIGKSPKKFMLITRSNTWSTTLEPCCFIKREILSISGLFDENIGPGKNNRYGAHEIDDLVIRLIDVGGHLIYDPSIIVRHDNVLKDIGEKQYLRAYKYGLGMGYVMKKHNYSSFRFAIVVIKPILASVFFRLLRARKKHNFYEVLWRSRLLGWQEYDK